MFYTGAFPSLNLRKCNNRLPYRCLEDCGEIIYDLEHRNANYLTEKNEAQKFYYLDDEDGSAKLLKGGLLSWKTSIEHINVS